jgi:hypothetical protein
MRVDLLLTARWLLRQHLCLCNAANIHTSRRRACGSKVNKSALLAFFRNCHEISCIITILWPCESLCNFKGSSAGNKTVNVFYWEKGTYPLVAVK